MKTSTRAGLLTLALLCAPAATLSTTTGCLVGECSLVGCIGGFTVSVDGGDQPLVSTLLHIVAIVDGGRFEVDCSFDDTGNGTCGDGSFGSEPDSGVDADVSVALAAEFEPAVGAAVHLHFEGSSRTRFGADQFGPDQVELEVTRDGMVVANASFTPEYTVSEDFNGKGCGDCSQASPEQVHLPPP